MASSFIRSHYEYLIVLSICMITFGPVALTLSCSGMFYTPVAQDIGTSPATLSYFIAMVTVPMIFILTPLGNLFNKVDCRVMLSVSVAIIALGFAGLSFIQTAWQYLLIAFLMGFGLTAPVYLAAPVLINRWFAKRAGFFVGLAMAFTGVGGVIWAPITGLLIAGIGWRTTYLVFAVAAAVLALPFTIFVLRDRPSDLGLVPHGFQEGDEAAKEYEKTGIPAERAMKMPSFYLLIVFGVVFPMAVYVYGMIPSYIATLDISSTMPMLGATAMSCAMAASIVAKIGWGNLAEKHLMGATIGTCGCAIAGVIIFLLVPGQWWLFCLAAILYGANYGEQTVFCPIATRHFFGMRDYSKLYSRVSTLVCVGVLASTFGGGTIINATGSYVPMFLTVSVCMVLAVAVLAITYRVHAKAVSKQE